jgi:hypothetical protein
MISYLCVVVSQGPWIICKYLNPQRVVEDVIVIPPLAVEAMGEEKIIWLTRYIIFGK